MNLEELRVRPVERSEELDYQGLMQAHHYLGAPPKIGETRVPLSINSTEGGDSGFEEI